MGDAAGAATFSKDFKLNPDVLGMASSETITISGTTDHDVLDAIVNGKEFPDRDVQLGGINFEAQTGKTLTFNAGPPASPGGTTVSFSASAGAHAGAAVFHKASDAIATLSLQAPPKVDLSIPCAEDERYLLMQWGYNVSGKVDVSHPIGVIGSASFGVEAAHDATYAVIHAFPKDTLAHTAIGDTASSWCLPRHVTLKDGVLNLQPRTWLVAEVDGSIGLTIGAKLGYDFSFSHHLQNLPRDMSVKIDAGLQASFGFHASGKFIVMAGNESDSGASTEVRLRLFKQKKKTLDFALNAQVGVQGDPGLPDKFDDMVSSVFGVYGPQVLKDLHLIEQWTDPKADLGQTLAKLANDKGLALLKSATGFDLPAEFDAARKVVLDALDKWDALPDKLAASMWKHLEALSPAAVDAFKLFLTGLAQDDETKRADALSKAIADAAFAGTPEHDFLQGLTDEGLLALSTQLDLVHDKAKTLLDLLNGGVLKKLQDFINKSLDLDQFRKAVTDDDFKTVDGWLVARLGAFLDKTLELQDLKDIKDAIASLDKKARDIYAQGLAALKKHYSVQWSFTYQKTTEGTALIDCTFDLSDKDARELFAKVVTGGALDQLLVKPLDKVHLNHAALTHEIDKTSTTSLQMPGFNFQSTHVNTAMANLTVQESGGRVLMYQFSAKDSDKVKNRSLSELSVAAGLKVVNGAPEFSGTGTIAYEMRRVRKGMRLSDLETSVAPFIQTYLHPLFGTGNAVDTFFADFDRTVESLQQNGSNNLGNMAVSMQVTRPASLLTGWLTPRNSSQMKQAGIDLSRKLQEILRQEIPFYYFSDLSKLGANPSAAALLVWSALPVTAGVDVDRIHEIVLRFDTNTDLFWDTADVHSRRAIARNGLTLGKLGGLLQSYHDRLVDAGDPGQADQFLPSTANNWVERALSPAGDGLLMQLLATEDAIIRGAAKALKDAQDGLSTAATAPTRAVVRLAQFAGDLTDTYNDKLQSTYGGGALRTLGQMILVESTAVLGGHSEPSEAETLLRMIVLRNDSKFALDSFLDGTDPAEADVEVAQTLTNLA